MICEGKTTEDKEGKWTRKILYGQWSFKGLFFLPRIQTLYWFSPVVTLSTLSTKSCPCQGRGLDLIVSVPHSPFPIPHSLFPVPVFPIPCSLK
ncbi:hypothetical protein NWP22_04000 [Anabaenopsis tanganyikae CS-531]|uniref:Uncharacterized protein n=1 Tax=Anabaenopsis tanganyikae CS-531 TaxID=2785304 RepID=A0ABT6KB20_9CYAN|nr:hypothetical protein [Anabaenopsis tanganyikae]MDH6105041.1 hypothetical protein [Anabaenopsis tanganyikae CS-531]